MSLDQAAPGLIPAPGPSAFGAVRVHTGASAARAADALGADAYTVGTHIAFAAGAFRPHRADGRALIAHELAHVLQQSPHATGPRSPGSSHHESQADRAAAALLRGAALPLLQAATTGVQRRLSMRKVGRREQSGFARLGELVDRLTEISTGLDFFMADGELRYTLREGGTLSHFDRQMIVFVDAEAELPLRLTNRLGRIESEQGGPGYPNRVLGDDWSSGYVDIDDLLASSALGLQSLLVHFLQERLSTPGYARRIGSESTDFLSEGVQAEFNRRHARGLEAEVQLLRDFFGDPSIRHVPGAGGGATARVFTNRRRDRIRARVSSRRGVDAVSIDVVLHESGEVLSAEAYRERLRGEREADAAAGASAP